MQICRRSALSEQRGKNIVLYFYPKDDTPGCTMEANEFSDCEEEFAKHDTIVVGVSRDDCISHATFRDKYGLSVQLLSDTDGRVCRKYGVLYEKEVDGHKKLCHPAFYFRHRQTGRAAPCLVRCPCPRTPAGDS